jgi:hypothetical protein
MKKALIIAGALVAASFAGLPEASAKDMNLGLTIGGPNGFIQISEPGPHNGPKYGNKGHGYQGYKPYQGGPGYGPGYGYKQPHPGQFNRNHNRWRQHCMSPKQMRHMLRYQGWHGFKIKKLASGVAIIHSHRHGMRYRIKLNRCTGEMIKVKPIGRFGYYGNY